VHTSICLSLDFFHRVFTKRRWRHGYADSVSPKLSHWVIGVFHNITKLHPSFSHWVFGGLYITIVHQLSKGEC
jgi:hypothetical protein